jgi:hypothetical protein
MIFEGSAAWCCSLRKSPEEFKLLYVLVLGTPQRSSFSSGGNKLKKIGSFKSVDERWGVEYFRNTLCTNTAHQHRCVEASQI